MDDEIATHPLSTTTNFNNYFSSIPGTLSDSVIDNNITFRSYSIEAIPEQPIYNFTDQNEINLFVKALKNSNRSGWDNIPRNVIKASMEDFVAPLIQLINESLQERIFTDALKIAEIRQIYNDKSKNRPD